MATTEVKAKQKVSPEAITRMSRGISGFVTPYAQDPKEGTLCYGMGCTIMGFVGTYNITSVEDALAIRLAAKQKNGYATYVILNLAYPKHDMCEFRGGNGPEILSNLLAAGWKVNAVMRGAHPGESDKSYKGVGNYESYLMGAATAENEDKLMQMIEEELKLVDVGEYPAKKKPKKKVE